MVAVSMDARWRHQAGESVEQLEGSEAKLLATVHIGLGEPVDQASLRRGESPETGAGVKPLQGERPAGAVADEPLKTRSVLGLDADGAINRKASSAPPGRQLRSRGGVQEATPGEAAQDAELYRAGQGFRVSSLEAGGLVKPDSALDIDEDYTVESQHMVVVVGVNRTPEALREGDGSELRVAHRRGRARACIKKCGPECPE